ncbi:putative toxin-antitoxin system toxin component, PIN family [Leptolyngbya sp. CCNP1308]|uniref:putative toxin-antitoxin system toxin component, PIN family n=1 Tax=Leptolyngbya sp. CCNP1308 TaxID=3110255 RepID=UPI002B2137A3|nr:putative toxin-antitoxin system toxin component, PIN family [Leptolyngbya sp. CCNP1308]MEA5451245.1 putative toxin-antitoxin system toxin component, PIN family [Leptolyngbya sp. CCNP1308]
MQYVAVFDTNILISALLSSTGTPFRCLAAAKIGQVESVTCQDILDEFLGKLVNKFKFSEAMAQVAASEVRSFSRVVEISKTLRVVPNDPDDDMVVECALLSGATHIVTGDKHLLSLINYQDIEIVKAIDFLALVSTDGG